jgi:hypothetical protein
LYVSLRSWTPEDDLDVWLSRQVHWAGEPQSSRLILQGGAVVVLLDGLDEVLDTRRRTARESIARLADSCPLLRIFVTCRDGAYDWKLFNFTHYAIRPFTWNEQVTWISRRLGGGSQAVEFLSALRNNTDLLQIAANPLALSIAAALYSRRWCMPTNLSKVIAAIVDAILIQWDGTRGVCRTAHPLSDPDNKRALFAELAAQSLEMISRTSTAGSLISLLHRLISVFRPTESTDASHVLGMLREHTGFITSTQTDKWTSTHSAISDYFAATAFVESVAKTDSQLADRLAQDRWQRPSGAGGDPAEPAAGAAASI